MAAARKSRQPDVDEVDPGEEPVDDAFDDDDPLVADDLDPEEAFDPDEDEADDEDLEEPASLDGDEVLEAEAGEDADGLEGAGAVAPPPEATFDDESDDKIVSAVTGEDDEDEIEGLREGEFVCRSCYMAKRDTQLADPEQLLCRDCA